LRGRVLFWTSLAVVWWLLIFIGTHMPPLGRTTSGPMAGLWKLVYQAVRILADAPDKVHHAVAFFGLAVFLCAAYESWRPGREWGYCFIFLAAIAYGALDEWTQAFIPYRSPDVLDWFADAGGAALGVGVAFLFAASRRSASAAALASAEVRTR
jgi:VanZ family protein